MRDKRSGNGGFRPGAGRKPDREREKMQAIIDANISEADWNRLFAMMLKNAFDGDHRAAVWLVERKFGKPVQHEANEEPGAQPDLTLLTQEELETIASLLRKAGADPEAEPDTDAGGGGEGAALAALPG